MNTKWRVFCGVCWNIALSEKRTPEPWRTAVGRGRWKAARPDPVLPGSRMALPSRGRPSEPADPHDKVYRHARREVFEDCPAHRRELLPPRRGETLTLRYSVTAEHVVDAQRKDRALALSRHNGRCVFCGKTLAGRADKRTCSSCRKPWSRMGQQLAAGKPFVYRGRVWTLPADDAAKRSQS